jgi:hypothetical protein
VNIVNLQGQAIVGDFCRRDKCALCVPWTSRLRVDVATHFKTKQAIYVKNRLLRIDVTPIYSADVVDYAFKSLKNGNATPDDIQVYH